MKGQQFNIYPHFPQATDSSIDPLQSQSQSQSHESDAENGREKKMNKSNDDNNDEDNDDNDQEDTTSSYFIHCMLVKKTDPIPDSTHLLKGLVLSSLTRYSPRTSAILSLIGEEAAQIHRVACLVASVADLTAYPPIYLTTPLDLVEESPELSILIEGEEVNGVSFRVTTTIPAYVWCGAFLAGSPSPSVTEIMRSKRHYLRDQWQLTQTGLQPDSDYRLYCYGESIRACPMEKTIESTAVDFHTLEGTVKVTDWLVDSNSLQFAIQSNLDREATCRLNGQPPSSQSSLINHFYFTLYPAQEYHLSCSVSYDSIQYSFVKSFGTVREIQGFGSQRGRQIWVFLGVLTKMVIGVMILLVIGAIGMNNWNEIR